METTNQIEKALEKKVNAEIEEIVDEFIDSCTALGKKYGCHVFQDLKYKDSSITTLKEYEVKTILFNSLQKKYGPSMLKKKSEELIAKLDLI
jgi:hypothetical protein|tara:strand:- start:307 stop:582 length:276 start_codon:yes stop_codon:yes gene_type:complete